MKIRCPLCGEMVTRKRLVVIPGLWLGRPPRPARCCEACFSKPDEEYREERQGNQGQDEEGCVGNAKV